MPDHWQITGMIIPASNGTFFNTKWTPSTKPLSAYDMLYHPPDYNPRSARSDRQEPQIIRNNIWEQEFNKGIPSTTHLNLGRPKWKPLDIATKQFVKAQVKNDNPHTRINNVLRWVELPNAGKLSFCSKI
ncbi:uncharacterized protein LOC121727752 [Aricia agestis]|uniref:uncharacterized protein LOC121727752 n=1 Tax=Aricia agestis TaxID=91739 RepID=UPI001C20A030|nr:uncharacterized protein LOC121727752 [Aricia agestis]